MNKLIIFFLSVAILSIVACTQKIDIEADVEALKRVPQEWDAACNAGDVDGLMSLYTNDAIRLPPNSPALKGKDAIRDDFNSYFDQNTGIESGGTVDEVIVCSDLAVIRGTYTGTATPMVGGEPIRDTGRWVDFHKRQPDGSWKIYYSIWNSDLPIINTQVVVDE